MLAANREARASDLTPIIELLACPACSGRLHLQQTDFSCEDCRAVYPVHEGVPLFALLGSTQTWGGALDKTTSELYQKNYQERSKAADYNLKYKRQLLKRMSTRREFHLLHRLLAGQDRCKLLLDLPCGGGRLSHQLAAVTDLLIEADIGLGQILYGRERPSMGTPRLWMTASAFHIPFCDDAVDATVCVRLSHHLPLPEERGRLIRELLRVSKRFVIMSFFDYNSLKNLLRRIRRPLNHKPPKNTMTVKEVAELARMNGASLVACPRLSVVGSGHRYALMVKRDS